MQELPRQSGGLDINIEDGVDFTLNAVYKISGSAVDVTGYTATFIIRDRPGHANALLTLTESAGITVGTTNGAFAVTLTDSQCNFGNREMVYDFVVTTPGGTDIRLLRGACKSHAQGD